MQEFLAHCTVFRNQFIFKNRGIIRKYFLHESSCSWKVLQLSCFKKNPVLSLFISVLIWNWTDQVARPGQMGLGFSWKTRPLEPYFQKLSMLPPRKNPSLQLSCFKFSQIRPLEASYLVIQKTVLFWSELTVFGFKFILHPISRKLTQPVTPGA